MSHYRCWQPLKYLAEDSSFEVTRLPDRVERLHWQGLTGPCNVPGIGSHADIIQKHDVIFSNFKADEAECARLSITAKLKKLVVDLDDDILHIPTDNPNYKFWFNEENGKDTWAEIPEGEEADPKWVKLAEDVKGQILRHPETGKLCVVQTRRHPCDIVIDELKAAQLVTVSTQRLKDIYGKYNQNTVVIPNAVDFDNFPKLVTPRTDGIVRLGLFGSNTHYRDWKEIAECLKKILDEFPNVRLCYNTWFRAKGQAGMDMDELEKTLLYPDYFDKLGLREHPQVEVFTGVEIQDYFAWLEDKQIDIGLAPLCESEFNKAKSNIKYLEFSALHIPGIYADMEPYNKDVVKGSTGFLAKTYDQWMYCLRKLITDPVLRAEMGDKAHFDVRMRYDQRIISKRLAGELKKIMGEEDEKVSSLVGPDGLALAVVG